MPQAHPHDRVGALGQPATTVVQDNLRVEDDEGSDSRDNGSVAVTRARPTSQPLHRRTPGVPRRPTPLHPVPPPRSTRTSYAGVAAR